MAQLVKNPPAMRETWVRSLGWDNPLEKGTATHSSILAWRIPWTVQSPWKESDMTELDKESDMTERVSPSVCAREDAHPLSRTGDYLGSST